MLCTWTKCTAYHTKECLIESQGNIRLFETVVVTKIRVANERANCSSGSKHRAAQIKTIMSLPQHVQWSSHSGYLHKTCFFRGRATWRGFPMFANKLKLCQRESKNVPTSQRTVCLAGVCRVATLALLGPNFKNLVPNNTSWPQSFRFALWLFFRIDLAPCKNLVLTTLVPVWEAIFFHFFD